MLSKAPVAARQRGLCVFMGMGGGNACRQAGSYTFCAPMYRFSARARQRDPQAADQG